MNKVYVLAKEGGGLYTPEVYTTKEAARLALRDIFEKELELCEDVIDYTNYDEKDYNWCEIVYQDDTYFQMEVFEVEVQDSF